MPVTIKTNEPKKPVAMAETPEFKELQNRVAEAKSVLDEVMTAIAALESKVPPQVGQPTQPTPQQGTPQQGMTPESITYNELERIVALTGK
jgi:hypothetical protein